MSPSSHWHDKTRMMDVPTADRNNVAQHLASTSNNNPRPPPPQPENGVSLGWRWAFGFERPRRGCINSDIYYPQRVGSAIRFSTHITCTTRPAAATRRVGCKSASLGLTIWKSIFPFFHLRHSAICSADATTAIAAAAALSQYCVISFSNGSPRQ